MAKKSGWWLKARTAARSTLVLPVRSRNLRRPHEFRSLVARSTGYKVYAAVADIFYLALYLIVFSHSAFHECADLHFDHV